MLDRPKLILRLIEEEGLKLKPYTDTVGKLTIGIGRNLTDVGITKEESVYLCTNNINECERELQARLDYYDNLPSEVQLVLVDLTYNIGITKFLTFKKTLKFIKEGNYEAAAIEILRSKWASQVGSRAKGLSDILKSI